jgi:ABC-type transport system involved in multi-copper enzyme maturation permease subunit
MVRAFRSEFIKLRRLSVLGGGAAMAFFTVLTVVITVLRAVAVPTRPDQVSLATLASDGGLTMLLNRSATIIPVIAMIIVAANMGAEYSQGTLRNLLVREPGRLRLVGGKFLSLLTFVVVCAVVALGLGIGAASLLAPGHGIGTSLWTSSSGLHSLATFVGNLALATVAFSIFGLVIALLFRSAAAAVGVAFAWFGIGENLLVLAYNDLEKVLPGQLVDVVRAGGTTVVGYGYALMAAAIWVVIVVVGGSVLLRRRDVTS